MPDFQSRWSQLEPQWQNALRQTMLKHTGAPMEKELEKLFTSTVLRVAGPTAPFPNMDFELTNLSALRFFPDLQIIVANNHQIQHLQDLQYTPQLISLFVLNNQIESLDGVQTLPRLQTLAFSGNKVRSLLPIQYLSALVEVHCYHNLIDSLDGLSETLADSLKNFYCLPNSLLPQKEIRRVESMLYIKCKGSN